MIFTCLTPTFSGIIYSIGKTNKKENAMNALFAFLIMMIVLIIGALGFWLFSSGMNAHISNTRPTAKTILLSGSGAAIVVMAFVLTAILI